MVDVVLHCPCMSPELARYTLHRDWYPDEFDIITPGEYDRMVEEHKERCRLPPTVSTT